MHTLIKRGSKDFYCSVCRQQWTYESTAHCPGMIVIRYEDRGRLVSKTELGKRGYKNGPADLPPSTCCYRMTTGNVDVAYVKLYDPAQCTPKKVRQHKTLHYKESLCWPKAWFLFLENIQQWDDEHRRAEQSREWRTLCLDLARLTLPALMFSPDELTALAGETVTFTFPLTPIRTQWTTREASAQQAEDLTDLLLYAYRTWKYDNRPPLTEAELDAQRLKRERREQAEHNALAQARDRLFGLPDWVTAQDALPPAVRRPLFDLE